jgi:acid stress-induced BolA-like protein IbaG/YrbA
MEAKQVEDILKQALELDFVKVKAEGSHYEVIVVGTCFEGASRVKKQQMIYAPLMDKISDGTLHAVSIKAYTPEHWERDRKLMML